MYEIKLELMDEQIAMKKAMKSILNASQFDNMDFGSSPRRKEELMKKKHLKRKKETSKQARK